MNFDVGVDMYQGAQVGWDLINPGVNFHNAYTSDMPTIETVTYENFENITPTNVTMGAGVIF